MNAAQRRLVRRKLVRDWPAGTLVTWGTVARTYTVIRPSRSQEGRVMITNERGREFAHPHALKRVPK